MSKNAKLALVPKLRFPEFLCKEAWNTVNIGEFLKESRIKGNKGDTAKKLTVKLWGNGVYEKQETLKGSENTQYFCRQSGQFIYSKLDFLNQAFGIIPYHLDNYESTVDLPCFDVSEELDARFLLEYVQRKNFYKKYGEIADGGRKAKRIQVETFLAFPMHTPKLQEQQKIADCLSTLDDLITAEDKRLVALKSHKKGLMQKLFPSEGETVPEWRFPEFRDSGGWEIKPLGDICDITTGKLDANAMVEKGCYRFYTCAKEFYHIDNFAFDTEALLVSGNGANVGYIHYYYGKFNAYQRTYVLNNFNENIFYINYFLKKNLSIRIEKEKNTGNTPYIVLGTLTEMKVLIPTLNDEQQKIANCFSTFDDCITAQTEKIEALKVHKKGLMQGLFPSIEEVSE